jgi:hypothetical protein
MWTYERPGRPGWYWFKVVDPDVPEGVSWPVMLRVSEEADGSLWVEDTVNRERYPVDEVEGLWAGPLAPPQAA